MSMNFQPSKHFKHLVIVAVLVIIALFITFAVSANEDDDEQTGFYIPANTAAQNFYGALRLGRSNNDYPDSNQDGSVTGVSTDENDVVLGIYGGYQFNDYVAVQGGYTDLGSAQFSGTSSGGPSWAAGPVSADMEADGWELGVLGRWPITDRWYALGFIGQSWWETKETFVEGSFVSTQSDSGSDITYALGFEFDHGLKDRFVYRFMGSHHGVTADNLDHDINTASAELIYRFP